MARSRKCRNVVQSFQRPANDRGSIWAPLPRKRRDRDDDNRTPARNVYPYADSYLDTNTYFNRRADFNTYSNSGSHAHAANDTYSFSRAYGNAVSDTGSHAHAANDTFSIACTYGDAVSDTGGNGDTNSHTSTGHQPLNPDASSNG